MWVAVQERRAPLALQLLRILYTQTTLTMLQEKHLLVTIRRIRTCRSVAHQTATAPLNSGFVMFLFSFFLFRQMLFCMCVSLESMALRHFTFRHKYVSLARYVFWLIGIHWRVKRVWKKAIKLSYAYYINLRIWRSRRSAFDLFRPCALTENPEPKVIRNLSLRWLLWGCRDRFFIRASKNRVNFESISNSDRHEMIVGSVTKIYPPIQPIIWWEKWYKTHDHSFIMGYRTVCVWIGGVQLIVANMDEFHFIFYRFLCLRVSSPSHSVSLYLGHSVYHPFSVRSLWVVFSLVWNAFVVVKMKRLTGVRWLRPLSFQTL